MFMVIGHAKQLDFLRKSWEENHISHAYLFVGPHGVGKRRVAAELAGWVLGKSQAPADLAQEFQICYVEREPNEKTGKKHKDITIEQIHAARNYLSHHSFLNSHKLVIIDEAEFMSRSASNALLKTLEEPAPQSTLILLTDDEKRLLPTIVSRCQLLRFYPVATDEIAEALKKMGVKKEEAENLARLSHHRPGRALELWREAAELEFYNTEAKKFFNLLDNSLGRRFKELTKVFGKSESADHIEKRDELVKVLNIWQGLWRDIMLYQSEADDLADNLSFADKIKIQSKKYSARQAAASISGIEEAKKLLRQNIHPRLIFENLVLNF